ncbi:MAG: hypothetical protein MJ177_01445 [Clostridia bacterium]|nr:hypothetical protein [Clostridia bacterium]
MAETKIISNINEAYQFVGSCAPFKIRKAVLSSPLVGENSVYLVALRGTNQSMDTKDPLGLPAAALSGGGIRNIYFDLVKNAILKDVPAGEMLVFIGHSLGGMVCQQLGADKELKSRYRILNVLTFGSPYILFKGSKCPLHRMAERADILPVICSLAFFANPFMGNVRHESGGYYFNFLGAHCDSYEKSEVWRKYDCFGIENGTRTLTFVEE